MSSGKIGPYYIGNYSNSKTWSGSNNPRPPFGEHPYSMSMYRVTGAQNKCVERNAVGQWTTWYAYRSDCNPEVARTFLDYASADSNCQAKAASQIRSFDAGVFLATAHQSVNQVVHAASSVFAAYRAIRKGDVAGATRVFLRAGTGSGASRSGLMRAKRKALGLNDPASQWLAFQYGWLPLFSDVYEGCEALNKLREDAEVSIRVSSRSLDWYRPGTSRVGANRMARVSRKYRITEAPGFWNKFGLTDPFSIAWELVPFSFVVDWFIPVGNFLTNYSVLSPLVGTVTKGVLRCNYLDYGNITFTTQGAFGLQYWSEGACHARCVAHNRTVTTITGDGIIRPQFKSFERAASTAHIRNAAALVTGFVASSRRG